eukprot:955680-Pyramimonas_sp.AAC.1
MQELEAEGIFAPLEGASDYLQRRVRGRVMGARLRGERLAVERALEEAVDRGHRGLSSGAADLQEALSCAAGH